MVSSCSALLLLLQYNETIDLQNACAHAINKTGRTLNWVQSQQ